MVVFQDESIPNLDQPVIHAGAALDQAKAALVMIHGRGASAQDILSNVSALNDPNFAYLAPQAPNQAWYPNPFTAPLEENQPYLSASLAVVGSILEHLTDVGIPPKQVILFGFSQGACLALEYSARNAQRYGGVAGLSGGLIGPDDLQRQDLGSLEDSPVFLGCSDVDPYIPKYRVERSADVLGKMGAAVTLSFYPEMDHTINQDELNQVRTMMDVIKTS